MKFSFESLFGGGKKEGEKGRTSEDSNNFIATPGTENYTTEDEALVAGIRREDLEKWQIKAGELETEIMNLRNQPDSTEKEAQLSELNTKLREINSKIAELNPS